MAEFAQGSSSYFGIGVQTGAIGTGVPATEFQSITSLKDGIEKANRKKVICFRKNLGYQVTSIGKSNVKLTVDFPFMPSEFSGGLLWALLMGNNNTVSGSAGAGYTHIFSEQTQASHRPVYGATIEALKGSFDNTLLFDFVGCYLKTLSIDIPEDGVITGSAEFLGVKEETAGLISSPTYTSLTPFESSMCQVQIGANLAGCADVEYVNAKLAIDTGVELVTEGKTLYPTARNYSTNGFNISGDITFNFKNDLTLYNYFKNNTEVALKFIITHTSLAGGSSGYHTITIELPRVMFSGDVPSISGEGRIPLNLKFEALRHISDGYTAKITVLNDESGVYSV